MRKKFKTIAVILALIVSSALLIGPYLQVPSTLPILTIGVEPVEPVELVELVEPVEPVKPVEPVEPVEPVGPPPEPAAAEIMIEAPNAAKVGELVRFDLSQSLAQSIKWIVIPGTADFELYNEGQYAVFSAREPGDYMFIVAGAYDGTVDIVTHLLEIVGPPLPDVPLIEPEIQASLHEWVSYWCAVNKRPKDESEQLAMSFETIAMQINAGTLQKATDIIKATAEANRTAVGDSLPEWLPVLQQLQTTMKELAGQGKLSTPEQHKILWLDIARGLRNYASLIGV